MLDHIIIMKTIARGFVELAKCLELAKFDDPDDEQLAEQVVVWCLAESSEAERASLCEAASELAADARAQQASEVVQFCERFTANVKGQYL